MFSWETGRVAAKDATGTARLVDRLLEVTQRVQHVVTVVANRYEVTPQQVSLLRMLDEPMSMRAFASDLSCDPSNVTGLVDRAERAGLVARVPDPRDRRVRMLTLTAKGRRIRDRVNSELVSELGSALEATSTSWDQVARILQSVNQDLQAKPR
jgi:DNA-binding MarR family transcriptional regulator